MVTELDQEKKCEVLYELGESEVQEIYYSGHLTRLLVLLWINALLLVSMANSTSTITDTSSTGTILPSCCDMSCIVRIVPVLFKLLTIVLVLSILFMWSESVLLLIIVCEDDVNDL